MSFSTTRDELVMIATVVLFDNPLPEAVVDDLGAVRLGMLRERVYAPLGRALSPYMESVTDYPTPNDWARAVLETLIRKTPEPWDIFCEFDGLRLAIHHIRFLGNDEIKSMWTLKEESAQRRQRARAKKSLQAASAAS